MTSQPRSRSIPINTGPKKRMWTIKEEEALLKAMIEVMDDKWKGDGGFKSGYFKAVEEELQKLLPGTNLKAKPNIESKVKGWKTSYGLITDMIKLSGFAWNHERQCIDVDDASVWSEYEKTHKGVSGMNGKPYPMYESWAMLFGRDRATGETAEDAAEVDEVIGTHGSNNFNDVLNDYYSPRFENGERVEIPSPFDMPTDDPFDNPSTPTANAHATPLTPTSRNAIPERPKKKSKLSPEELAMNEAMQGYMAESNVVLGRIADGVGFDTKLSEKRTTVFVELEKLDLDDFERFKLNNIIVCKEERVDTFYGVPIHLKQVWAKGVLDGTIPFDSS